MIFFKGTGYFETNIVGESFHQSNLAMLAGPKKEKGVEHLCLACLVMEDDNPHDSNAVAVCLMQEEKGFSAGHLSRADALSFRTQIADLGVDPKALMFCQAAIIGGWRRVEIWQNWDGVDDYSDGEPEDVEEVSEGHYGVKLDLLDPLEVDPRYANIMAERKA